MSGARPPLRDAGQASVELLALVPLAAVVGLACAQLLAAGWSAELAGTASEAGAIALVRGQDPEGAARDALPGWAARWVDVSVDGRRVRVRLPAPRLVSGLADELRASSTSDAGPTP